MITRQGITTPPSRALARLAFSREIFSISPYAYVNNNPLKYIDPDGKMIGQPQERFGNIKWFQVGVQQKVEKMQVDSAIPAAVSVNIGGSTSGEVQGGFNLNDKMNR